MASPPGPRSTRPCGGFRRTPGPIPDGRQRRDLSALAAKFAEVRVLPFTEAEQVADCDRTTRHPLSRHAGAETRRGRAGRDARAARRRPQPHHCRAIPDRETRHTWRRSSITCWASSSTGESRAGNSMQMLALGMTAAAVLTHAVAATVSAGRLQGRRGQPYLRSASRTTRARAISTRTCSAWKSAGTTASSATQVRQATAS